ADPDCNEVITFAAAPLANDWETYQAEMIADVNGLEAFWERTMPDLWGIAFESPCVVEYDPATVPYQDSCGVTPEVASENAFYCIPEHAVMWDGPSFYHPLYAELGDKALLFVTAHEYGHAVQFTRGEMPQRSVNLELQADCYAGAYLRDAVEQGDMTEDEASEVIRIVAAVGQSRVGSTWFTRTHGTSAQRLQAVASGYEAGVSECEMGLGALTTDEGLQRPSQVTPVPGDHTITTPNNGEVTITIPDEGGSVIITDSEGEQRVITPPRGRPSRASGDN
ncbi:MAG: neutral zinc metallopeptidase, partial [Chloroflexota bacterium]